MYFGQTGYPYLYTEVAQWVHNLLLYIGVATRVKGYRKLAFRVYFGLLWCFGLMEWIIQNLCEVQTKIRFYLTSAIKTVITLFLRIDTTLDASHKYVKSFTSPPSTQLQSIVHSFTSDPFRGLWWNFGFFPAIDVHMSVKASMQAISHPVGVILKCFILTPIVVISILHFSSALNEMKEFQRHFILPFDLVTISRFGQFLESGQAFTCHEYTNTWTTKVNHAKSSVLLRLLPSSSY